MCSEMCSGSFLFHKFTNRRLQIVLTNTNARSIITISETHKAHPIHTNGVGAPLNGQAFYHTQIQQRYEFKGRNRPLSLLHIIR